MYQTNKTNDENEKSYSFLHCSCGYLSLSISYAMLMRPNKAETLCPWLLKLRFKLYLVDLRANARYHVTIVPKEWLSASLDT